MDARYAIDIEVYSLGKVSSLLSPLLLFFSFLFWTNLLSLSLSRKIHSYLI